MYKRSDYVRIYMTSEGPKIIESPVKANILSLLETDDLYFDELLVKTKKSKPNLSNHLKILEEKGIIGSNADLNDKRKKSFYIKAKQLAELSSNINYDIDVEKYFKNSLISVIPLNDPTSFYGLLFTTIRLYLGENGIDIYPLLFNIGNFTGESIYEYVKSPETENVMDNVGNLWKRYDLGDFKSINVDPITIRIDNNFECKDMVNIARSNCAIGAGIFESIFSKHFGSEVLVDEVKCVAKGDDHCLFNIKKVGKKTATSPKSTIEII